MMNSSIIVRDVQSHAADLDAHTYNIFEQYLVGGYYPFYPYTLAAFSARGIGRYQAFPFYIARALTLDRIAVEVGTTEALKDVRLGIYNDNGSSYPGTRRLNAGTIDCDTAGVQAITISHALPKGLYWWVIQSESNTPTLQDMRPSWDLRGLLSTDFSAKNSGLELAGTYADGLPDPFTAGATDAAVDNPCCGRVLTLD